jgi:hypothetical protein
MPMRGCGRRDGCGGTGGGYAAAEPIGGDVNAVNITGGGKEAQSGNVWNVPKRDLMAGVQVLLEKRELKVARGLEEAGPLVRELTDDERRREAATG